MIRVIQVTDAEKVVRRISELRDLARRLAKAGYEAGLHRHDPGKMDRVAERIGKYSAGKKR